MIPEKTSKKHTNDHSGHRKRMKNTLLSKGAPSMTDAELLEMFLYYAVPRSDTRILAEDMLLRFGSLESVLSADLDEIKKFSGLKENAEVLFTLLRELSKRVSPEEDTAPDLADREGIKKYLISLYRRFDVEIVYVLYYDTAGIYIGKQMIFSGDISSARFSLRTITEGAIRAGAKNLILAHNHPGKSIVPSDDDVYSTRRIAAHLNANEINLAEHYIIGGDKCVGILHF